MHIGYSKATAIAIMAILAVTCVSIVSDDSDADAVQTEYGTHFGLSMADVNKVVEKITGKTVQELLDDIKVDGYELKINPDFDSDIAVDRHIDDTDAQTVFLDRISAYLEFIIVFHGEGNFPDAGVYPAQEGEDVFSLLYRILQEEKSQEFRILDGHFVIGAYIDVIIETVLDKASGELVTCDPEIKIMIVDQEERNFSISSTENDDGTLQSVEIGYGSTSAEDNIYADFEVFMDFQGMDVTESSETWEIFPSIDVNLKKSAVSSDLAGGLGTLLLESIGKIDKAKRQLPELILNILQSTDKVMDIAKTLTSLTNMEVHDILFLSKMTAQNYTDESGYKYVILTSESNGKQVEVTLPITGFNIRFTEIIDILPESILSDDAKAIIDIALVVVGWDSKEVPDITNDKAAQAQVEETQGHVSEMMSYDEDYKFSLPLGYLAVAIIGVIASIAVFAVLWRRL